MGVMILLPLIIIPFTIGPLLIHLLRSAGLIGAR